MKVKQLIELLQGANPEDEVAVTLADAFSTAKKVAGVAYISDGEEPTCDVCDDPIELIDGVASHVLDRPDYVHEAEGFVGLPIGITWVVAESGDTLSETLTPWSPTLFIEKGDDYV